MNYSVNEFTRIMGGLSLPQSQRDEISEYLIKNAGSKKELSGKHIAVASCAVVLAAGVFYAIKGLSEVNNDRASNKSIF